MGCPLGPRSAAYIYMYVRTHGHTQRNSAADVRTQNRERVGDLGTARRGERRHHSRTSVCERPSLIFSSRLVHAR